MKIFAPLFIPATAFLALSANAQQEFEGVWSGAMTTPTHEFWKVEDVTNCWGGCPKASYEFLVSLLDDPANDDIPWEELSGRFYGHMHENLSSISTPQGLELLNGNTNANNPAITCHDYGYLRQSINPLPMQIVMEDDMLHIDYEEWNQSRRVYMDGRDFPDDLEHTQLGYSIGHYDEGDLVIETRGITAEIYNAFSGGGGHSDQLTGIERYSLNESGSVLTVEIILTDPVTLKEPYVFRKDWVATPEVTLLEDSCTDIPGEF